MSDVNWHVESLDAWISAGIRQVVPMAELSQAFDKGFVTVAAAAAAAGAELVGPAYACYFGMPTETVDVELGFGVRTLTELPELVLTQQPAIQALVGTHVGPYADLRLAYDTLPGWLAENPTSLSDTMFEFYDSEPGVDPPITRMVFPLV